MADISKIKIPNNTEYNVKDAALTAEITNARGSYVNLDARLDNYDEVIGDIDTALSSLLVDLAPKTITQNGTYDPTDDNADGYSSVTVDVPNTYTQVDEGKVVSNGVLVAQTAMSAEITANDTYDTTLYNFVTVNVPTDSGTDFRLPLNGGVCRPCVKKQLVDKYWTVKTWSGYTSFIERYIWTDGENIYYSDGSIQKVLDKSTSTWINKTWNGLTNFYTEGIWTDGDNIYYSYNDTNKVLDKSTSTWTDKTWGGMTSFYGQYIWTDGENIYYSDNSNQKVLNKSTSTWGTKTWRGLTSFSSGQIWTDGENIYYSSSSTQYVLDKSISTWDKKTWYGLTDTWYGLMDFSGDSIWTDGENIYCAESSTKYVLNIVKSAVPDSTNAPSARP